MEIETTWGSRSRWFLLRRGDQVGATVGAAVFAVCLISSVTLPFGHLSFPGPGLWPVLLTTVGLVASLILFLRGRDIPVLAEDQSGRRLLMYLACIVLYAPLYSLIGFVPASALVLVVLVRFAGGFGWTATVTAALAGPALVYAVFGIGLEVPIDAF